MHRGRTLAARYCSERNVASYLGNCLTPTADKYDDDEFDCEVTVSGTLDSPRFKPISTYRICGVDVTRIRKTQNGQNVKKEAPPRAQRRRCPRVLL